MAYIDWLETQATQWKHRRNNVPYILNQLHDGDLSKFTPGSERESMGVVYWLLQAATVAAILQSHCDALSWHDIEEAEKLMAEAQACLDTLKDDAFFAKPR